MTFAGLFRLFYCYLCKKSPNYLQFVLLLPYFGTILTYKN